jgi:recombination protein RecT
MSVTTKPAQPSEQLRVQLRSMTPEFASALPDHIKPEKFQRVVMTVVQQTPDLLAADRRSLLGACMKCAADGLIPDGREAALVIFNTNTAGKGQPAKWEKRVQYMPMLAGILKRARNSGEIAGIVVNVVYEKDDFVQRPDDFERPIEHRPPKLGVSRGAPIGAYALAKLKDGTVMHEVMDRDEIEKIRAVSRSKDSGPWAQWWDQMARKSVFRRLSKYLPMDADPEDLMRRDDEAGTPTEVHTIDGTASTPMEQIEAPSRLDAMEGTIEGEIDNAPENAGTPDWPGPTPEEVRESKKVS